MTLMHIYGPEFPALLSSWGVIKQSLTIPRLPRGAFPSEKR